ncbi:MAG: AMP-binding protein, partial [Armatimonadota bacterium]|nr:AMP-binding protein [Armatimonadota bacterium]
MRTAVIAYPLQSIRDYWQNCVARFPRKTAFIGEGESVSYAEAHARAERLRGHLEGTCGLKPGGRVGYYMPNCLEYAIAYWATINAGGVAVPINTRLRAEEARHIAASVEADILFVHADLRTAAEAAFPPGAPPSHRVAVGFEGDGYLS